MHRDTCWNQNQGGYYFSNRTGCKKCYQAQTHTSSIEVSYIPFKKGATNFGTWRYIFYDMI